MNAEILRELSLDHGGSILLAVMDGVGDLPSKELDGMTPLEAAETPNLDGLSAVSALGQHIPVERGITPGSGPGHLALFGYDPVEYLVGRGVLAALGIGFSLKHGDLAARINFCTLDGQGIVTDRRAGRIPTEKCRELTGLLGQITIPGVQIFVEPVKEHRACVVFRGPGLQEGVHDTDPGLVGEKPLPVTGPEATAGIIKAFIAAANVILADLTPANGILLRGFALHREMPTLMDRLKLNSAAVALYPMYKGVASLAGMEVMQVETQDLAGETAAARRALAEGKDFVFLHHKYTDSSGEDGDFARKVREIERFDSALPGLLDLGFDVVCITGDHSTPCSMKLHSWHPVPVLLQGGPQRTGWSCRFTEREAAAGALGTFRGCELMQLLMAASGRLGKFGA